MNHIRSRKKLIEVALPLDAINAASAREKSIRHGHPSTLHLWWARRPLAAARAVLFAQLVDDPSAWPELFPTEAAQQRERERLFRIIEHLVVWEHTTNEEVLERARCEIRRSWARHCLGGTAAERLSDDEIAAAIRTGQIPPLPGVHDPFAGGGSIPLEAQRLGLEAYASDLNPVAVTINKAMIEIPPKFAGMPPVNPESRKKQIENRGAADLNQTSTDIGVSIARKKQIENRGAADAFQGTHRVAEGNGDSARNLSSGSASPTRGDLRHAFTDHAGICIDPSQHRGRLDAGVSERESAIPGNCAGIAGGTGDAAHPVPGSGLVSSTGDADTARPDERSGTDADDHATTAPGVGTRSEEIGNSAVLQQTPISSFLSPISYKGAQGLAEDVRYYGQWMREEAQKRIGHLYPKITAWLDRRSGRYFGDDDVQRWRQSEERGERNEEGEQIARECGHPSLASLLSSLSAQQLTVIAWLWARTVKSPNPAFAHVDVPLVTTFILSSKPGNEAYVEPVIENRGEEIGNRDEEIGNRGEEIGNRDEEIGNSALLQQTPASSLLSPISSFLSPIYRFTVKTGKPPEWAKHGTKLARGANFRCLLSGAPIAGDYIKAEGQAGQMGARMLAIVAEGPRGRVYLPPTAEHEAIARSAQPTWKPDLPLHGKARDQMPLYGMETYGDLFTPRQLVALTTFADLVGEAIERVKSDYLHYLGARASRPRSEVHRTRLPHWEAGEAPQHIIFRLADSLPTHLLAQWEEELRHLPETRRNAERRQRIEQALDAGHGSCLLRDPALAQIVEDALLHFDGLRYRLHEWAVMPNHVHVLVTPLHGYSLSSIVHSWKSYTAKAINRVRGSSGPVWQEDYFDRMVRDETHFAHVAAYVRENPQRAGLPEDLWVGSIQEAPARQRRAGRPPADDLPLHQGGTGATAYAQAVGVYLALALDKVADRGSTLGRWDPTPTQSGIINAFSRQALPMTWDFAESNPLGDASGNYVSAVDLVTKVLLVNSADVKGFALQSDAQTQTISANKIISTDPPYYDNIGYADLSDFFYVWLRRMLRPILPDLYATLSTPKAEELVATPYRHGSKPAAERFFLEGMTRALHNLAVQAHPAVPVTIYYAFKQHEVREAQRDESATGEPRDPDTPSSFRSAPSSTGWETFLEAVIQAGFAITGTWPMRTELGNRILGQGTNALASSIVLVCRPRPADAPIATRREFLAALKAELPAALAALQRANIAPVDLAQAAIGPGMAIYTRYARVVDAQGNPVRVREALALINQVLDEVLAEQEGDFDADTRWALAWFEQHGFAEGDFGVAETLSKAKNTSIEGLAGAGILEAKRGRVRLLKPAELTADWDPARDTRFTHWEAVHHLIRVLETGGEMQAAEMAAKLGSRADVARELAYRLYTICERKKRPDDAFSYNALVQSWGEIGRLALDRRSDAPVQMSFEE
jgi:putative DNA methylase